MFFFFQTSLGLSFRSCNPGLILAPPFRGVERAQELMRQTAFHAVRAPCLSAPRVVKTRRRCSEALNCSAFLSVLPLLRLSSSLSQDPQRQIADKSPAASSRQRPSSEPPRPLGMGRGAVGCCSSTLEGPHQNPHPLCPGSPEKLLPHTPRYAAPLPTTHKAQAGKGGFIYSLPMLVFLSLR